METSQNNIDPETLYWKFFAGEATQKEKEIIFQWVKQSEANKKSFQASREAFISVKHPAEETTFDQQKAFNQFAQTTAPQKRFKRIHVLSIAASFALLFALSLTFLLTDTAETAQQMATYTSVDHGKKVLHLPDSSSVLFHGVAELSYALEDNNVRKAYLRGEAFFDITHDAQHPFEVEVGDLTIRVLGTSFIIDARPEMEEVTVRVLSGRVMVSAGDKSEILTANEAAVYHLKEKKLFSQPSFDVNDIAWKTNKLTFNETPLEEVADKLSLYFEQKIIIQDSSVAQYPLSVEFSEPELESVITLLELTFGIQAEHTDSLIMFK